MTHDEIVQEVRDTRAKIFEECDCDLDKYFDRIQEMEALDPRPRITLEEFRLRYGRKSSPSDPIAPTSPKPDDGTSQSQDNSE